MRVLNLLATVTVGCLAAAAPCQAAHQPPLMRDFIGLNGHTVQFKPDLYAPVGRLVRDYHPVEWDLHTNTTELPKWPFAKNGVDWSKVYGSWHDQGWTVNASLMFETVRLDRWQNLEKDARAYAEAFAQEFGPSGNRKLLQSVEIGNEPGKWSDADYSRIFRAMAEGVRAGDPQLKICSCNLTTGKSGDYEKSVTCLAPVTNLVDVLTLHTYPQMEGWPTWKRSFPEDPKLPKYLQDVEALCRWRDAHTPGKPVWITEFGYDSTTKPPAASGDFAKWIGVTDTQQAQWLVRSLLLFSSMPVSRAYIYFFNDDDQPQLHGSSGLTRHFEPKPSLYAVSHLQRILGDYRFKKQVSQAPAGLRIHEYAEDSGDIVWAVWSPTGNGTHLTATLQNVPGPLLRAEHMPLDKSTSTAPVNTNRSGELTLTFGETPIYLLFKKP